MTRRFQDMMGQAIAPYGFRPVSVFGQANGVMPSNGGGGGQMTLEQAYAAGLAAAQQGAAYGAAGCVPYMNDCYGQPAYINPCLEPKGLVGGIFGPQCGPALKRTFLQFGCKCAKDCESVTLTAFPQYYGNVKKFVVSSAEAASFVVEQICIGAQNLFAGPCGSGSIPAAMLSELAVDLGVSTWTFFPNQPVTVTFKNISGAEAKICLGAVVDIIDGAQLQLQGGHGLGT
jgi:hypothetical protein